MPLKALNTLKIHNERTLKDLKGHPLSHLLDPLHDHGLELLDVGGGSDPDVESNLELVRDHVQLYSARHHGQIHRSHVAQGQACD